jgi:hypothetical protein
MKRVLLLKSVYVLMVFAALGVACAPAATTTPGGGTPAVAAIVGTWVNNYQSEGPNLYTNTYIFNADGSYSEMKKGLSLGVNTLTNSGTYAFANNVMTFNQILSGGSTNLKTMKYPAFIDGNNYYSGHGSIYALQSGAGWSGVYKNFSYNSWVQGGTNIIYTNFMVLTSTTSNITVTAGTNCAITNGVASYYQEPMAPPVGTVISWTNTSSDDWHSFDMMGVSYFNKVSTYIMYSSTNVLALSGLQWVKQ